MGDLVLVLVLLVIACLLCGPIALILSIIALRRTQIPPAPQPPLATTRPPQVHRPPTHPAPAPEPPQPVETKAPTLAPQTTPEPRRPSIRETLLLEQRIGTRWVPIAGVISVLFAVGFFLKFAYDSGWIGPLGRVAIAAAAGLVALTVGEVTRRRGYENVAKGVTALGFAILYATVFAAHRWYALIDSAPAFALAAVITAAAMLYAVAVHEITAAVLSLVGGFITPLIIYPTQEAPSAVFTYALILGAGAMLCAYYRKWPAVNILAFAGTILLYTVWFERYYRPSVSPGLRPDQMGPALLWIALFFAVYLVLPILHGLVRKVQAATEDVALVAVNALVALYYFWSILYAQYRPWLALTAVGLGAAHLALLTVVTWRCRQDRNLGLTLLGIALAYLTIAIPLYLQMHAVVIALLAEAFILALIGLRYRNTLIGVAAAVAAVSAICKLTTLLPMHTDTFAPVFNRDFGTWCFAAATFLAGYAMCRIAKGLPEESRRMLTQVLYPAAVGLLMAAVIMEVRLHSRYNIGGGNAGLTYLVKAMTLVFVGFLVPFLATPVCPPGIPSKAIAAALAAVGSLFVMVSFPMFHREGFAAFANADFAVALTMVAGLFGAAWLLNRDAQLHPANPQLAVAFALASVVVLWVLLTEEVWLYWRCQDRYVQDTPNWRFAAHMCVSITWALYGTALMAVGFWKRLRLLRYVALCIFVFLLVKVFTVDTRTVRSIYRIVGFLATGITLVGVSYLYQFLKKQGFFETILAPPTKSLCSPRRSGYTVDR